MNDTLTERSTSGFDRAQSHYDNMEPPEVRECSVCDSTGRVRVASILDADNKWRTWPLDEELEIDCPFCIDGVKQPDGDWEIQRRDSLEDLPR